MKIYGDYTFLLDKLNVWNNSRVQILDNGTREVQFADKFLEEQRAASHDEVSISQMGMEYLRDSLSDLSGNGNNILPGNIIPFAAGSDMSLMDGFCRTYILQRLDTEGADGVSNKLYGQLMLRYQDELYGKDEGELSSHAESLARSYAAMRKQIVDGYENGTREVWTMDKSTGDDFSGVEFEIDGSAVRYRKLTKEEELENLDKAFARLTEDIAKELSERMAKEAEKRAAESGEELSEEEKEFWYIGSLADSLIKEINDFLDKLAMEEAMKNKEKPLDFGERLAVEMRSHGIETEARGKQLAQYANYRKMSKMTADVQTLLGYLKA